MTPSRLLFLTEGFQQSEFQAECSCLAEPEVLRKDDIPTLKWNPADEEGIVKFLVEERNFNEARVRGVVKKINTDRGKSNQGTRLFLCCSPAYSTTFKLLMRVLQFHCLDLLWHAEYGALTYRLALNLWAW